MSARLYPVGEPMRHKATGTTGTVDWTTGDDVAPSEQTMVIRTEDGLRHVQGEATWEWESLLGPG